MKIASIFMCIVIIFLGWLQDWLPMKNRQFWNKGLISQIHCMKHWSLKISSTSFKERRCEMGFTLERQKCQDIDECLEFPGLCRFNVHCTNTIGSYSCGCWHGYEITESGCEDIDECSSTLLHNCHDKATCTNFPSNFNCTCNEE